MARPTTKPRVPALDPEHEAITFVRDALEHWRRALALLDPIAAATKSDPSDAEIKRTRLYRDLLLVARYAIRGETAGRTPLVRVLDRLAPLLQSPLRSSNLAELLASIDPDEETHAVKLLLAAAVARADLASDTRAVTSTQLAILAGLTRRHVGAEIRDGRLVAEIAGRRGTAGAALVRPAEARRWLRSRSIAGYVT